MSNSSVYIFKQTGMEKLTLDELQDFVIRAQKGDEEGFTGLYNATFDKIYRFIYYRVSHKEVAEDLTEEAFLKAFKSIGKIKQQQSFEAWLYVIARNIIIDYYRSKRVDVNLEEVEHTVIYYDTIIDTLHLETQQQLVLRYINELPEDQQKVLKLKFFEDLENEEIAALLSKNEGAIRVIQHRALTRLKELIDTTHNE